MRLTSPFNLPAPGRCQSLYFGLRLMQRPVFLVNSRLSLVSATSLSSNSIVFTREAPLLPKLRGQLAEFLNESYPAHLSLLSQPTCVGFGYEHRESSLEAFLDSRASMASVPHGTSPSGLGSALRFSLQSTPTPLARDFHHPGPPSFLRHPFSINGLPAGQEYQPAVHRLRPSASP